MLYLSASGRRTFYVQFFVGIYTYIAIILLFVVRMKRSSSVIGCVIYIGSELQRVSYANAPQ